MKKILIASKNRHKIEEIESILKEFPVEILTLNEFMNMPDVEEDSNTIEGNSLKKALEIAKWSGLETLADDTGLEIEALGGEPGVFTARFAGVGCSNEENIEKTLNVMAFHENRRAVFKTIITLAKPSGEYKQFEGILEGEITRVRSGLGGFGYDPIFKVSGCGKTLAELGAEKHALSHRGRALQKFAAEFCEI